MPSDPCDGKCDDAGTSSVPLRNHLLANLIAQMDRGTVMFGQQRFNITGVATDGTQWLATPGHVDRSDVKTLTGDHPVVMGFDAWDLAFKPETWAPTPATHAEAAKYVYAQGGIVTMDWHMRGCTATASFNAAGNEACLCKLANDDAFARAWLIDANYAQLADALVRHGLDRIPIVFRPLHEHNGGWFWWGQSYWNCAAYVTNPQVTGPAAYQRVYRTIVDYLRAERGLDNLLFAYSPSPIGEPSSYLTGYPGDAYVDVLGIDLYYQGDATFAEQSTAFASYLDTVSRAAYDHGKAAAVTEIGNTRLATDPTPWFTQQLLPLLTHARVAYAMTWENRRDAPGEFWVPFEGHTASADFEAFAADERILFGDNAPALYQAPRDGYPMCAGCDVDRDGDGWGWENQASCRVGSWCRSAE